MPIHPAGKKRLLSLYDNEAQVAHANAVSAASKYLEGMQSTIPGQFDFTITPKASGGLRSVTVAARTSKRNASDWDSSDSSSQSLVTSSDEVETARKYLASITPGQFNFTNSNTLKAPSDSDSDTPAQPGDDETPEVREARNFLRNVKPDQFNFSIHGEDSDSDYSDQVRDNCIKCKNCGWSHEAQEECGPLLQDSDDEDEDDHGASTDQEEYVPSVEAEYALAWKRADRQER